MAALGLVLGLTGVAYPLNFLLLVALILWVTSHKSRWIVLLAATIGTVLAPTPSQLITHRQNVSGLAQVVSVPTLGANRISFEILILSQKWMATLPGKSEVALGDQISVHAVARPWPIHLEPWARWHGLAGSMMITPSEMTKISSGGPIAHFATFIRASFVSFVEGNCPPEAAAMIDGLCFNVSGLLDPETSDDLRKTGLIHAVSASGFHVTIIVIAISSLATRLPIPRLALIVLLTVVLALYALATGLHAAIVRACLMSILGMSAYLFRKETDFLSALGLSLIAVLLWRPSDIYDSGLQLSFVTFGALGLVKFRPMDKEVNKLVQRTKQILLGTFVATAASMPLVAYHFGAISLISPVANVLIGLLIPLIVVVSLGSWLTAFLLPGPAGWVMQHFVTPLVEAMKVAVQSMASLPGASVRVPEFSGYAILFVFALALWAWRRVPVEP